MRTLLPRRVVKRLRQAGVLLSPGLSDRELNDIEARFEFQFSNEHRQLLSLALPLGKDWVDWRSADPAELTDRLARPISGVIFDVENNAFWPTSWGERPAERAIATQIARARLADVPQLVPVFSHRYLPAGPAAHHSPVLSVHQTDVIYYGNDLLDYVAREFNVPPGHNVAPQRVPFWTDLIEGRETAFWDER
jgi:hypothetical protein